jgi:phage-related protein
MANGLTLPQPRNPDEDSTKAVEPRVRRTDFGDGYAQRSRAGINNIDEKWSVSWSILTATEASAMDDFFRMQGGVDWFWWRAPGDSVAKKWTCPSWQRSFGAPINNERIQANFQLEYDP